MLIGQPREVLQNSLITFPVINEESNHPFSQNVENHRLLWLNWLHKTTLGLTIFSALLVKGGFLNTFWQGCLTALNSPDMQCIIQKNYNFFIVHQIRANMESKHWHRPTNNAGCLLLMSPCMVAILWHHKPSNSTMNVLCC